MATTHDEEHFKQFGERLRVSLSKYGKLEDVDLLSLQRKQLETLFGFEQEFKALLQGHRWGDSVYRSFVDKICVQNGNILTSRPYFRERQTVCIGPISAALKRRDHRALYRFNFNYQFVLFAVQARRWWPGSRIRQLAKMIERTRADIVELNAPLAISQARIFWSKAPAKVPATHLQYMDFVQISCDGLISAVDKFVLPSKSKFRSEKKLNEQFRKFRPMMVQRMVGNFIEGFSETMIHFVPTEKRKLYRANKFLAKNGGEVVDYDKVAAAVDMVEPSPGKPDQPAEAPTSASEISNLLLAASNLITAGPSDDVTQEQESYLDRYAADENMRPDVRYEKSEAIVSMRSAMEVLPVFDRKLLRLKGVQ